MQFVGSMRCVWFAIPKKPAHIERIETTTSTYFGNSVLNTMPKNPKKKSRGISALLFAYSDKWGREPPMVLRFASWFGGSLSIGGYCLRSAANRHYVLLTPTLRCTSPCGSKAIFHARTHMLPSFKEGNIVNLTPVKYHGGRNYKDGALHT